MTDPVAAPAAPAAAPAAAAPAAPAATPAADPAAAPAANWFDSFGDQGVKDWVASIGAPNAEAVASKALNLERMLGADRAGRTVVLPKDGDADAWGEVWSKLGRPADPAGYALPVPEGASPEFAQVAAQAFHKAGLTAQQAQSVSAWWNEHVAAQVKAQQDAEQATLKTEHEQLAADWGGSLSYDRQKEIARRGAQALGLEADAIDALEKVVGFSKVMKALAKVGELTGEDKAIGVEAGSFGMTPEAARGRKAQLIADKTWRERAMVPNSAEWAEIQRLDRIIAAGLQDAA